MKKFLRHQFSKNAPLALTAVAVLATRGGVLPPNVSPLGASGFATKQLFWFFVGILAFDLLRGGFYPGVLFTYLGFAMYPTMGKFAGTSLRKQALFLPIASLLFFLLSNFGVWWFWYPQTWAGLVLCYTMALPFYRNTFLSDVGFFAIIAGVRYVGAVVQKVRARELVVA
ncbi:MAG: hypothetical protein O2840_04990 [bacterium]|nr:hypothetical protein [bacterium]